MRFADYLGLAYRSLRRSRLRSGLTISAIVVGATGITIMLTFVTSVKNYVVNEFVQTGQINQVQVSETPNLTYSPNGENGGGFSGPSGQGSTPTLTAALEAKIASVPHVTGVAATAQGIGNQELEYLSFGGHQLSFGNISDYEPDGVIEPPIVAGRDLRVSDTANAILLTTDYADALGFKGNYVNLVGQTVELHTQAGYTGAGATLPSVLPPPVQCSPNQGPSRGAMCGPTSSMPALDLPAVVVGVVNTSDYHETLFMPMSWAIGIGNDPQPQMSQCQPNGPRCFPGQANQAANWTYASPAQFLADNGGYQSFIVAVDDTDNVAAAANTIDHFGVSTATGLDLLNKQKQKTNVVGLILGSLGLIALGIAALGVMNTMVMSVLERTREIGVMRALGARRSTIRRLFVFEAAGLGFFGGAFGVAIGYVFVLVAKSIIAKSVQSGSSLAGANFSVPLWLVVVVIAGTTLIGFISGALPARRAARLDPIEALRYE